MTFFYDLTTFKWNQISWILEREGLDGYFFFIFLKKIIYLFLAALGSPVLHGHSLVVVSRDYKLQCVAPHSCVEHRPCSMSAQ